MIARCRYCEHLKEPIGGDTCTECMQSGCLKNFKIIHQCSTCIFVNRSASDDPCVNCITQFLKTGLYPLWTEKEEDDDNS